ncbi:hypothetical protein RYX36_034551 [Vicia faba]
MPFSGTRIPVSPDRSNLTNTELSQRHLQQRLVHKKGQLVGNANNLLRAPDIASESHHSDDAVSNSDDELSLTAILMLMLTRIMKP